MAEMQKRFLERRLFSAPALAEPFLLQASLAAFALQIGVDKEFSQTFRSVFRQFNNCSSECHYRAVLPCKGDPGLHLHLAEEETPRENPLQVWFHVHQ